MLFDRGGTRRSFIVTLFLFWILIPAPGSTVFWLTGSISYLWMAMLACGFLCCLWSEKRVAKTILLPLALLAGNSHEGIASGLLVTMVLYAILDRDHSQGKLYYAAFLMLFIGFVSNVAAPGTFVRMGNTGTSEMTIASRIGDYYLLLVRFRHALFSGSCGLIMGFAAIPLSVILNFVDKNSIDGRRRRISLALLGGSCVSAVLTIMAAGDFYERVCYGSSLLSYLSVGALVLPRLREVSTSSMQVVIYLLFLINFVEFRRAESQIGLLAREEQIIHREACKDSAVFLQPDEQWRSGRYIEQYAWFPDINRPHSKALSEYLGVKDIAVFKDGDSVAALGDSRLYNHLVLERWSRAGKYLILPVSRRPQSVRAQYLYPCPPTQFDGLRGLILNEALKRRSNDTRIGCYAFARKGAYYVFLGCPERAARVTVEYENGDVEEYPIDSPEFLQMAAE